MEIYDEEVERKIEEQEALAKIQLKEERAELLRDIRQGNWKKIMGQDEEAGEEKEGDDEVVDPFEGVVIEYEVRVRVVCCVCGCIRVCVCVLTVRLLYQIDILFSSVPCFLFFLVFYLFLSSFVFSSCCTLAADTQLTHAATERREHA